MGALLTEIALGYNLDGISIIFVIKCLILLSPVFLILAIKFMKTIVTG